MLQMQLLLQKEGRKNEEEYYVFSDRRTRTGTHGSRSAAHPRSQHQLLHRSAHPDGSLLHRSVQIQQRL